MKKMLLITLSLLVLLAAACALLLQEKNITVGRYFTGSGGHYLIADSPLHLSGATSSHTDNGDKLLVPHGPVAESYPAHSITFAYRPSFGVCGTGLETKEITLPSGLKGSMGTYDGKPYWSYIALEQDHVITLSCDGAWWSRHRDAVTALVNALYLSTE